MPRPQFHKTFLEISADYTAAKRNSRLRRRRRGVPALGASADFHYRNEADYLWMAEMGRELDRNDVVIGQTIDRAVDNTLQGGLSPEPDTGDPTIDQALKDRWSEESIDPDLCDLAGNLDFHEQTRLVLRDALVAGDIFGVPTTGGQVQLLENHRCRSPHRTKRNIVHGVEMTDTRKRLRYWFTKEPIDPLASSSLKIGDLEPVDAYTADQFKLVWQVYFPKRATQTRGVSALAPILDAAAMHDDLQFAELLHRQVASCFFVFRNRTSEFTWNNDPQQSIGTEIPQPGSERRIEGVVPGLELSGAPGEMLSMGSPQIPNQTFFPHVRLILTFIGINLGVPLVMVLMDASETNFSGYRGAIDQARLGFRANQQNLIRRWCRPYWWWKVSQWLASDTVLAAAAQKSGIDVYRHKWRLPAWPYIEPMKDAQSDLVRQSNMLISPSRCSMERGHEWQELASETIRDRRFAVELAVQAAQEVNQKYQLLGDEAVRWRDLAPLPNASNVTVGITDQGPSEGGSQPAAQKQGESQ